MWFTVRLMFFSVDHGGVVGVSWCVVSMMPRGEGMCCEQVNNNKLIRAIDFYIRIIKEKRLLKYQR